MKDKKSLNFGSWGSLTEYNSSLLALVLELQRVTNSFPVIAATALGQSALAKLEPRAETTTGRK